MKYFYLVFFTSLLISPLVLAERYAATAEVGTIKVPFEVQIDFANEKPMSDLKIIKHRIKQPNNLKLSFFDGEGASFDINDKLSATAKYSAWVGKYSPLVIWHEMFEPSVFLVARQSYRQGYGIQDKHDISDWINITPSKNQGDITIDLDDFFNRKIGDKKERKIASQRSMYGDLNYFRHNGNLVENTGSEKHFSRDIEVSLSIKYGVSGPRVSQKEIRINLFRIRALENLEI